MSEQSDYYQLKGIVSELTSEQQAQVAQARQQAMAIVEQSEVSVFGITLALMQLAAKG
ncbi:hypothetical protein ACI2KS_23905 [Pseudomonas sp. NPDC087358]|uniref:hypothetical protein n=1 Tax=Pseudomonas sp. NPDC087358 TaxID=3364439 RepID=UPI00384BBD85